VELIIFVIALIKNEIRIVQASLLGSILANLLLILGMAFTFGGLLYREQLYNSTVTQMSACLLSLSVMSLLLPTAFHASFADSYEANRRTLQISRGTSVVLLCVYALYLCFQLKSHSYLYKSMPQEQIDEEAHPGILADILDSSTSSSDNDSSGSDTDTTSGSHNTANRIRRAFRRRRIKSNAHSEETRSVPSHLSSPAPELNGGVAESSSEGHRTGILNAVLGSDDGVAEEIRSRFDGVSKVRDFERTAGSISPDRVSSPESKRRRKWRSKRRHKKKKSKPAPDPVEVTPEPPAADPVYDDDAAAADAEGTDDTLGHPYPFT